MNRPYSLNSARFLHTGRDNTDPRHQTPWERERMLSPFPDARPSLSDRHPFLCTLGLVVLAVAGCFALFAGVMPR